MMFAIPGFGDKVKVRLFEEVKTEDTQYNIVDCGLQYKGENDEVQIDSLAMGGSFHTLKSLCGQLDKKAEDAESEKAATKDENTLLKERLAASDERMARMEELLLKSTAASETEEAPASEPQPA